MQNIESIILNKTIYYDFKSEFYAKFYDIFFSTEYNPEILKKNMVSLSSLCNIISSCKSIHKYKKNVTAIISALLLPNALISNNLENNSIKPMCDNLNKLFKNKNLRINVENIVEPIEKICTWTNEYIEKNDKSRILLKTMKTFLELI